MPLNFVNELVKIAKLGKVFATPTQADWTRVEKDLNLEFPEDYKNLVSKFGSGSFGLAFYLKNPVSTSEYTVLSHEGIVRHFDTILDLKETTGLRFYPESGGAVVIGNMERQDFLLTPGKKLRRLNKLLWLDIETGNVRELEGSISKFIFELYMGKLKQQWAKGLREYIWGEGPLFTPWEPVK